MVFGVRELGGATNLKFFTEMPVCRRTSSCWLIKVSFAQSLDIGILTRRTIGDPAAEENEKSGAKRDATTEARTSPPFSLSSSLPPFRQLIR
uniref:Uncharacterized protein n=1 Tax=Pristionchus pacificus TaxID=54126 RepID=A0A2A6CUS0_PRIPA|eukprot:PDM81836.1 hypothetical protein PRIPAC_33990 [Pristionchus pacificus]